MKWRKSSRSNGTGGECVELARVGTRAAVRDSKNPKGSYQVYDRREWRRFLDEVRQGKYDI
jgi:hypothetical protein